MDTNKTVDLTSGSIVKKFLAFTLPILASNILQHFYNAADMMVVGRFAGDNALAAVGATGSLITLFVNLFIGLSTGANIICSNMYGAKNKDGLSRCMQTSILVSLFCGFSLLLIGVFLSRFMLQLMDCPEAVLDQAALYMQLYLMGAPFSMLYNFGAAILRSHGDTRRPMIILMLSGLANVGLNLLLVIVFHMDVAGVAIATVASQILSAVAVIWILFSPKESYGMKLRSLRIFGPELKRLVAVGLPCGINSVVFSLANVILQTSVNSLGEVSVAAAAASSKITGFVYMIPSSAYSACVSFAGQCYGAKHYKRIDELLVKSILLAAGATAVVSTVLTLFPGVALSAFSKSAEVISTATPMMIVFLWSYVLYAIPECTMGCVRGMGISTAPTVLNMVCVLVPRIIWNYFFFPLNPTIGWLYVCIPISYVICSAAQLVFYSHCRKKLYQSLPAEEAKA